MSDARQVAMTQGIELIVNRCGLDGGIFIAFKEIGETRTQAELVTYGTDEENNGIMRTLGDRIFDQLLRAKEDPA